MPDWRHAIERRLEPLRLPPTREAEVVEELAQHLDDRYEELRSAGAPDDEARRAALAEVDDADLVRELTGIAHPAVEPLALGGAPKAHAISGLWQDIRFGARLLVKDAGASLVIGLTLGLAIAANAIVFGFTDRPLLRPLPIGNTDRLVQVESALRTFDLIMALFGGFAAIGLAVAVTGVYGVTAFSVGQRRHEIGVRMALGATARDVIRLIAGRTLRLIANGAALGIAGGWAIGLSMRGFLFGVGAPIRRLMPRSSASSRAADSW